ncbi:MAG: TerC family protein [Bacteroidota bacterium]
MQYFFTGEAMLSLLTLTLLEIVLGVDNVIFISIVSGRLPVHQQDKARKIGIMLALVARVGLLFGIKFLMGMTQPWFTILGKDFTGRNTILFAGGVFLIYKTVSEIVIKLRGEPEQMPDSAAEQVGFMSIIFQIVLVDIVFSFDSILTAVGLVQHIEIMITAVIISMGIMYAFSGPIGDFVNNNPTVKMLALCFLVLIGAMLVAEVFIHEMDKSYVYFAMAFALGVEMLNRRVQSNEFRRKKKHGNHQHPDHHKHHIPKPKD